MRDIGNLNEFCRVLSFLSFLKHSSPQVGPGYAAILMVYSNYRLYPFETSNFGIAGFGVKYRLRKFIVRLDLKDKIVENMRATKQSRAASGDVWVRNGKP
jgi:hypothetical protein